VSGQEALHGQHLKTWTNGHSRVILTLYWLTILTLYWLTHARFVVQLFNPDWKYL